MFKLSRSSVWVWSIALLIAFAIPSRAALAQATCAVNPSHELLIRDLSVVEDCQRTTWGPCPTSPAVSAAWTFGRLMEGIAGTTDPKALSDFVLQWLSTWETDQFINGHIVAARPRIRDLVTDPWLAASGGTVLDMKKAPFRLLAIVARLDLRSNPLVQGLNAGEARFVFGVVDLSNPDSAPSFTVILEYGLKADTCDEQKKWAQLFHSLGTVPFGPTYNADLQSITDLFTTIGSNPAKPNGSSINQVRTDEIALASPWQLREFTLQPGSTDAVAPLRETTVKQVPSNEFNGKSTLADYINQNEAAICAQTYIVPEIFEGQNFLGGSSQNNFDFWNAPGIVSTTSCDPRHIFSLNTCNGCHGRETDTRFTQIDPRSPHAVAGISGFLGGDDGQGIDVADPVTGLIRHFNELQFRANDLCRLLTQPCSVLATDPPRSRVE